MSGRTRARESAILGILFVLAIYPAGAADIPPRNCMLNRVASLDARTESDGRISVAVRINDKPARLVIDTGDIHSTISYAFEKQYGLKPVLTGEFYMLAGGIPIYEAARSDTFKIDQMGTRDYKFMAAETAALDDSDGLLGEDILQSYDVELDFAHSKVNLFLPDHCPGLVVYWSKEPFARFPVTLDREWHINVPVVLDGKAINAVIDTGARRSTMTLESAKTLFGIDEKSPTVQSKGNVMLNAMRDVKLYRHPFANLQLEGIQVYNPDIDILTAQYITDPNTPLILGINVLRQLHVYIAYKEGYLYATRAEAQ